MHNIETVPVDISDEQAILRRLDRAGIDVNTDARQREMDMHDSLADDTRSFARERLNRSATDGAVSDIGRKSDHYTSLHQLSVVQSALVVRNVPPAETALS